MTKIQDLSQLQDIGSTIQVIPSEFYSQISNMKQSKKFNESKSSSSNNIQETSNLNEKVIQQEISIIKLKFLEKEYLVNNQIQQEKFETIQQEFNQTLSKIQKQDQQIKTLQKQDDKLKEQNYKLEQQKIKIQTKYTTLQEKYNNLYQGVQIDLSTYDGLKYQNTNTFSEYYNNQLNLYLTQISAKCSHNSFEIGNIYQQLQFDETVAYQGGCQMLEFDIFAQNNTDVLNLQEDQQKYLFYTTHDLPLQQDKIDPLFDQLLEVQKYHEDNPSHLPLFITFNLKPWIIQDFVIDNDEFYKSLEQTILSIFDIQDIYLPKTLLNGEENLFMAVQNNGIPKVIDLLGKIILLIDPSIQQNNNPEFQNFIYTYINNINNSLMFSTFDSTIIQNGVYDSIQDYMKAFDILKEAKKLNLITRGWNLSDIYLYTFYKQVGVNFLCTDYVFDTQFAVAY